MPQKSIPNLKLIISGSIIEHGAQCKFLSLNIDSNLNCICLQLVLKCPELSDCYLN